MVKFKRTKLKHIAGFIFTLLMSSILSFSPNINAFNAQYQPDFFANNNIYYYNPNDVGCIPSTNGDGSGLCTIDPNKLADNSKSKIGGNISNANSIIAKLSSVQIQGKTLSTNQIAAIIGNGVQESSLDPNASNNGVYVGVWQWSSSRFTGGAKIGDLDSQIDLLIREMESGGWADRLAGKGGLEPGSFFEMDDINELTKKFVADYEAAVGGHEGYQELSSRQKYAREVRAAISCTESTTTSENESSSGSNEGSSSINAKYAAFFDKYHESAVKAEIDFGLPWEAILVQASIEGDWGKSSLASKYNNHFGIKATNAPNSTGSVTLQTQEEVNGVLETINADFAIFDVENSIPSIGYFLTGNPRYAENGTFNHITNPEGYFKAIHRAGYATDSSYVSTNMSRLNTLLKPHMKSRGWNTSEEVAKENPQALENAKKYANGATGESSGSSGGSAKDGCETASGDGALVDGGMSLSQATDFMRSYYDKPDNDPDILANGVGSVACSDGFKANCVTFSTYFINKYTNIQFTKNSGGIPGNGSQVVGNVISRNLGIKNGSIPMPYSVFSYGSVNDAGTGGTQHTGIVLGIDKKRNVAIIGEANCNMSGFSTGGFAGVSAREQDISTMGKWRFAYLEDNLNGEIK